jgi:lipopolysaccharide/colanic/teichoic acid biosynthesis glycosyltransferase
VGGLDGKRALDLVGASVLAVLTLPIVLLAAIAVLLADGRPAFFAQARDGRDGSPFTLWKIRTMRRDAEAQLATVLAEDAARAREFERLLCLRDDPRILPGLGRLLRRSSIDELPQLLNVLRGDMSLVGPRPVPVRLVDQLSDEHLQLRRRVRPGLTGLWQVRGRSTRDMAEWAELDSRYVAHQSLRTDIAILARTPFTLLRRTGAY